MPRQIRKEVLDLILFSQKYTYNVHQASGKPSGHRPHGHPLILADRWPRTSRGGQPLETRLPPTAPKRNDGRIQNKTGDSRQKRILLFVAIKPRAKNRTN